MQRDKRSEQNLTFERVLFSFVQNNVGRPIVSRRACELRQNRFIGLKSIDSDRNLKNPFRLSLKTGKLCRIVVLRNIDSMEIIPLQHHYYSYYYGE
jgi:hypothetical protein